MVVDVGYESSASYTTILCRLRMYAVFLFYSLSTQYLIMASIDGVLISSSNALTRRRSTYRLAFKCIIIDSIFWIVFHCHTLFLTDIVEIATKYYSCNFQSGWYSTFTGFYTAIISLLTPLLLAIFGLWTLKNIRSVRHAKIVPVTVIENRISSSSNSKDRQLILMLLTDIVVFVICCPIYGIFLLYLQFIQSTNTVQQAEISIFIRYVSLFMAYIPFCISCYIHLFISKTFRTEVKNIFKRH